VWSSIRSILDSNYQTYLDDYIDGKLAHTDNVEFEGCEYCRLRGRGKFKLHPDSLYLYFKDAMYIINVWGLIHNIRFLYRMFKDLRSNGYDIVIVGKSRIWHQKSTRNLYNLYDSYELYFYYTVSLIRFLFSLLCMEEVCVLSVWI